MIDSETPQWLEERVRQRTVLLEARAANAEAACQAHREFLAVMSHELRNTLSGLIGLTELLVDTELTPVQRRFAVTVQVAGNHLIELSNRLRDFSNSKAREVHQIPSPVDLRSLAEEALAPCAGLAIRHGLALSAKVGVDVPALIWADPMLLRQVLINLVGNGVKFTERGEVQLRISRLAGEATQPDGLVGLSFEVQDTGIGIESNALARVFNRDAHAGSSRTHPLQGTGLGLSICNRLVRAMGGRLHVDSEVGLGSRFHFDLRFKSEAEFRIDRVVCLPASGD